MLTIITLIGLVMITGSARVPIYRYWSGGDHFYTANADEIGTTTAGQTGNHGYTSEGVGFMLPDPNNAQGPKTAALLRYWNGANTDHFYTTNYDELGEGAHGWVREGDLGRCFTEESARNGLVPLYRYWNAGIGDHFYTTNYDELGAGAHGWVSEGITCYVFPPPPPRDDGRIDVYRYWSGTDHFYTTNADEIGTTTAGQTGNHGYTSEGVGFRLPDPAKAQGPKTAALLRYWNGANTDHFYTTNYEELGEGAHGWVREGDLGRCFTEEGARAGLIPLYRYWNAAIGDHFYTTNYGELGAGAHGWVAEGVTCYVFAPNAAIVPPFNEFHGLSHSNNGNWVIQGSTFMYMVYVMLGLLIINLVMMSYMNCYKPKSKHVAYKQVCVDSDV